MSRTNSREPTRAQLSSRLQYAAPSTPAFLQRLKDRVAGVSSSSSGFGDDDAAFDEWEAQNGRVPIPRRPRDDRRGADDGDDETDEFGRARRPSPSHDSPSGLGHGGDDGENGDDGDEAPQIVVLKEGKHLTEREVENERRKARGLSPLPETAESSHAQTSITDKKPNSKEPRTSLSFSSVAPGAGSKTKKRKLALLSLHGLDHERDEEKDRDDLDVLVRREKDAKMKTGKTDGILSGKDGKSAKDGRGSKKRTKTKTGALLSFGNDG